MVQVKILSVEKILDLACDHLDRVAEEVVEEEDEERCKGLGGLQSCG